MSKIIESVRKDLTGLYECGAISKVTLKEFNKEFPPTPPVRELNAKQIKKLRESLKVSQPVFAAHLNTTASTIRKWEQGETKPTGPALKLLNMIKDKGLQVVL